jgi:DinB family protein
MAGPTAGGAPGYATGTGPSAPALRSAMLSQLMPELDRIEPRTRVAVSGLPESKFRELPPEGGWSIAQVFEHLCRTNLSYLDGPLATAIEKARSRGPSDKPWRPSLTGGWLAGALVEGTKPLPTAKPWRVTGEPPPNVVDAFLDSVERLRAAVQEADGHDLRVGLSSPVSPLIRLNLGDAFRVLVVHCHRHLAQVERTRRAVGM